MSDITRIGLDLAKNSFHIFGVNQFGKQLISKKLSREKMIPFFSNLSPCTVAMEACSGAHYWATKLQSMGHTPKIISPQYVKPFVKRNKNDAVDAEAIYEASIRPNMHFVPIKSMEQLEIQAVHRIRERLISARTAATNQARGFLAEAGIVIPKGIHNIRNFLFLITSDDQFNLSLPLRDILSNVALELIDLEENIKKQTKILATVSSRSPVCRQLRKIPGIGPITATAVIAAAGDGAVFKNGRQFAAWVGLTPRQHSTGGKTRLLGISKRGDSYLRKLLVHGARAVLYKSEKKTDRISLWIQHILIRRGKYKAMVALANKIARIVWVVLTTKEAYHMAA